MRRRKKKHLLPPVFFSFKNLADRQHKLVYVTEEEREKKRKQRQSDRTEDISEQLQDKASHSPTVS